MSGKAKKNELLVNSREYDSRYYDLYQKLDQCSEVHIDCSLCPIIQECQNAWDSLANFRTHRRLKPKDVKDFEAKFKNFHKQLLMV